MRSLVLVLIGFITITFFGCQSIDYQGEKIVVEQQVSDIHLTFTLQDKASLLERFGKDANPFIDFPGKLPPRYFFVFDTKITTEESTVDFSQREITIRVGSDYYKAANPFSLQKAWEPYQDNDSQELRMKRIINKSLKPVDFTVSPDSPYQGMLVFLINVKDAQEATILIPAKTPEGDEGVIEVPFQLKKMVDGEEAIPSENSGIFAE